MRSSLGRHGLSGGAVARGAGAGDRAERSHADPDVQPAAREIDPSTPLPLICVAPFPRSTWRMSSRWAVIVVRRRPLGDRASTVHGIGGRIPGRDGQLGARPDDADVLAVHGDGDRQGGPIRHVEVQHGRVDRWERRRRRAPGTARSPRPPPPGRSSSKPRVHAHRPSLVRARPGSLSPCASMEIHFLGGATTVTGSQFLLVTGQATRPHRLRDVPGQPERVDPQPDPVRLRPGDARRRPPDPRPPRPLRADAAPGQGRLSRPDPRDAPARSSSRRSSCSTRASSTRSSRSARRAGRSATRTRPRPRIASTRRPTRPPWRSPPRARTGIDAANAGAPRPRADAGRRGVRDRATGEHVETTIEPERATRRPPAAWPTRPRGGPPRPAAAPRRRPRRAALHGRGRRARRSSSFRPIDYGEELEVAPGVTAVFVDAGHILGSAIIRLRVTDTPGGEERVIVCSGDLGRPGTPILRDPTGMTAADYVLVESTYGGREHEPQDEAIRILAETVRMVADAKGVLLVPSFAIGRTQEVVWELDRLIERGEIPLLPLYLDSPMASKASDIYRHHPDYYDEETAKLLREGATPLDYPNQIVTNDVKASQAIAQAPRPYMIVASNGMLTGGRVVGHLRNLIDDPTATILFVGYQGEGTLGAHLQAGAKRGQARRPAPPGALPDPLDQRLLGPRRRARAARLAARVRRRQAAGRSGLSAQGLPRPRRPGGADRASSRRCATSASPRTSRTGTSGCSSTESGNPRNRSARNGRTGCGTTKRSRRRTRDAEATTHRARHRLERHPRRLLEQRREHGPVGCGPVRGPIGRRVGPRGLPRRLRLRRRARPSPSPTRRSARSSSTPRA